MMKIELWPIRPPVPYAKNPRKIPQSAIDKVAAGIKEFGWRQSIVVDAEGVIVVGQHPLACCSQARPARGPGARRGRFDRSPMPRLSNCRQSRRRRGPLGRRITETGNKRIGRARRTDRIRSEGTQAPRLGRGRHPGRYSRATGQPCGPIRSDWQLGKHRLMCGDLTRPECISRLMDSDGRSCS